MAKYNKTEIQEAIERLNEWVKPGDTVYCVLRSHARSGMRRVISLMVVIDGTPRYLDYSAAVVLGYKLADGEGIKVSGGGMDMGFHLVYNLGAALYPDGFECVGDKCRSNDHFNGDRDYTAHKHNDGGYALKHQWL